MNEPAMKYIDEFRDRELIMKLARQIERSVNRDYTFMEVCGGHTAAIQRFGLPSLLPEAVSLISGPGCPVCVTPAGYIDVLFELATKEKVTIATFGDLIRVPGSSLSLAEATVRGADVRVVLSASEALNIARSEKSRRVLFPAIGFETTAPGTAVTVMEALADHVDNFLVLSAHKVMPPAMDELIRCGSRIDGFICPGHVSVITGSRAFEFIPQRYRLGCVITGFEPTDILSSVLMLIRQISDISPRVEIQYRRAVRPEGNQRAQQYMNEVFEPCDAEWRGLGVIPSGGLRLREKYSAHDAFHVFGINMTSDEPETGCICGDILRGLSKPSDCALFATVCTPDIPTGACMVSEEGACNSWYKYHRHE
jgi:hydrogenase expression/formation protein HypD